MSSDCQTSDLHRHSFACTNPQTITQRVALLKEIQPRVKSIAELCCGDRLGQPQAYHRHLAISAHRGLDIQPDIVAANRARGIDYLCGDALDPERLRRFLAFGVVFFFTRIPYIRGARIRRG